MKLEEMSAEEQDKVIDELLNDDSVNKKTVSPVQPPKRKVEDAAGTEEKKGKTEENKKQKKHEKDEL